MDEPRRLSGGRERGAIPHFRRIVIETSGLADPGPILQTFATDRALGGESAADDEDVHAASLVGRPAADSTRESRHTS